MKHPRPLPGHLAAIPFTVSEALGAGVARGRLQNRSLVTPSRGIRVPAGGGAADGGPPPGALLQLAQLARPVTRVTGLSAASHATAFRLWEYPGFLPGADAPGIHISRPDTVAISRRRGVIGHRGQFFADEIVELNGMLVTSRVRTWLLSAGVVRQPDLAYSEYRVAVEYEGEGHSDPAQIVGHRPGRGLRGGRLDAGADIQAAHGKRRQGSGP